MKHWGNSWKINSSTGTTGWKFSWGDQAIVLLRKSLRLIRIPDKYLSFPRFRIGG